jgi:hypothetical protein
MKDEQEPTPKPQPSISPPKPPRGSNVATGFRGGEEPDKHVRVIGRDGRQLGIMMFSEAMKIADTERAELVRITPTASAPVYRMVESSEHQKPKHTS